MKTDDKTALRQLIESVEAGEVYRYTWAGSYDAVGKPYARYARDAYNGSLDAGKALHEALLPDMEYAIYSPSDSYDQHEVQLETPDMRLTFSDPVSGSAENPARAWLIAILKAYEAQQ